MPYVTPEEIQTARHVDLLTYLRLREPGELVRVSGNTYTTKEHDSLKISNGKWYWFSKGVGGVSALDYLIKVRGYTFLRAVEAVLGKPVAACSLLKKLRPPGHSGRDASASGAASCPPSRGDCDASELPTDKSFIRVTTASCILLSRM